MNKLLGFALLLGCLSMFSHSVLAEGETGEQTLSQKDCEDIVNNARQGTSSKGSSTINSGAEAKED